MVHRANTQVKFEPLASGSRTYVKQTDPYVIELPRILNSAAPRFDGDTKINPMRTNAHIRQVTGRTVRLNFYS